MKKLLCLLTIAMQAGVFAQVAPSTDTAVPKFELKDESARLSSTYTDLGMLLTKQKDKVLLAPSISFGRRVILDDGTGIDVSAFYSYGEKHNLHAWSAPKMQLIHFWGKKALSGFSPFYTIGTSFGGVHSKISFEEEAPYEENPQLRRISRHSESSNFVGFFANASLGGEFYRKGRLSGFTQVDLSQPAVAVSQRNASYYPLVQFKAGCGF